MMIQQTQTSRARGALRATRLGMCALTTLLLMTALTSTASAQRHGHHGHGHHDASAEASEHTAYLRELKMYRVNRQGWMVDYTVGKRSWRAMKRAGIKPQLLLYSPGGHRGRYQFLYAAELPTRKGRLVLPPRMGLRGARTVEARVIGYNGFQRVVSTQLGRQSGRRVRIVLDRQRHNSPAPEPAPPVRRPPPTWKADVIDACGKYTRFSSEKSRCMDLGFKLSPYHAASMVHECGKASTRGSALNMCLQAVPGLRVRPVATIQACKARARFDSDFRSCLSLASQDAVDPDGAVRGCAATTGQSSAFATCMNNARSLRANKERTILACSKGAKFASERNRCIGNAAKLNTPRPDLVVAACASSTSRRDVFGVCVQYAPQLQREHEEIIKACGARSKFSSEMTSCMTLAKNHRFAAAGAVSACTRHSKFTSTFNSCMNQTSNMGRGKLQIIESCGNSARSTSDFSRCLASAGR